MTSPEAATRSTATGRASAQRCESRELTRGGPGKLRGRRLRSGRRLPGLAGWARRLVAAGLTTACLAGCGGGGSAAPATTAAATRAPTVVNSSLRTVSFVELRRSIDDLYRSHPGVESFVAKDVQYTPATRDKVLSVCHRGGPETD